MQSRSKKDAGAGDSGGHRRCKYIYIYICIIYIKADDVLMCGNWKKNYADAEEKNA